MLTQVLSFIQQRLNRPIATLVSGTLATQFLAILASPIITRLYSADDLGFWGVYLTLVSIASILFSGRFDLAVPLPKSDRHAVLLGWLSIKLALVLFCICVALEIVFLLAVDTKLLDIKTHVLLIPFAAVLLVIFSVMSFWAIRKEFYKALTIVRLAQSGITTLLQVALGLLAMGSLGLVFGYVLGLTCGVAVFLLLLRGSLPLSWRSLQSKKAYALALRYKKFPKYLIFAHLLNLLARQSPLLILPILFSPSVTGLYFLVHKVFQLPFQVLAKSVGEVFLQEGSARFAASKECAKVYIKTVKPLLFIAIAFFPIVALYSPDIFSIVFGSKWKEAGVFGRILAPVYILEFISVPVSAMFTIAQRQQIDAIWQICLIVVSTLSLYVGSVLGDVYTALYFFSFGYSALYLINMWLTWTFARGTSTES
jgi:O-antigen/teichoic acid export membrane protein